MASSVPCCANAVLFVPNHFADSLLTLFPYSLNARAEGSPTHNATLAPFKVRLTNELTDLLKLEDGIWLEIVALGDTSATTNVGGGGKTEWMVGSVG